MSPGSTVSVPGFADRELSSGDSTLSLVLRKNPSAGGHGPAHPRAPSNATENAARGRSGLGSATENRRGEVKSDSLERRFGSLHGALGASAARWWDERPADRYSLEALLPKQLVAIGAKRSISHACAGWYGLVKSVKRETKKPYSNSS